MTVSTKTLINIAGEMAVLADTRRGDPESDHPTADELLVQTIKWLAAGEPRTTTDLVDKILADYERVGKWYA